MRIQCILIREARLLLAARLGGPANGRQTHISETSTLSLNFVQGPSPSPVAPML